MTEEKTWRSYEEVARFLLDKIASELGLHRVEGKQHLPGLRSGTKWEIDAKGVSNQGDGVLVVEIRRHTTSRLTQEDVAAIAYRIRDTGSVGGIIVAPLPLQSGAQRVANAEGIVAVQLNENSTTEEYVLRFLKHVMVGLRPEALTVSSGIISATLTTVAPAQPAPKGDA